MAAKYYAIKSCVQSTLKPIGAVDDSGDIAINFVNTFSQSRESDSLAARADGVEVITLESNVKYTFTLGMEVLTEPVMAMIMGAEYTKESNTITAKGAAPTTVYSFEGVFTLVGDDGSKLVKKMTIGKCRPVVNNTIDFSAIDLSTFELQFTMLIDNDEFFKIINNA